MSEVALRSRSILTTFGVSQGTSHRQQAGAQDREETEGGDDPGRGREETCRPVQRTGNEVNMTGTLDVEVSHRNTPMVRWPVAEH